MKELEYIQFGLASTEYILRQSVVEINSTDTFGDNSVYDERMGPLNNSNCKVCFQNSSKCTGHFGHINLVEPIPNPHFTNRLMIYLTIFCWYCSKRILATLPKRQKKLDSYLSVLVNKSKNSKCHVCGKLCKLIEINEKNILMSAGTRICSKELYSMLSKISLDDLKEMGIDATHARPCDYLFEVLPVLPHLNRPSLLQGSRVSNDDLTAQYLDIIKNNNKAKKYAKGSVEYETYYSKIVNSIRILINNTNGSAKHPSSGRTVLGIVNRFTGKEGIIRNNVQGKRSDQTARAVASPGPDLTCSQIGVPRAISNILTRPIITTDENINYVQQLCDDNKVDHVIRYINGLKCEFGVAKFCNVKQTRLEPGDVIMRQDCLPIQVETGHEVLIEGDRIVRGKETIIAKPSMFRKFTIKIGDVVSRYLQDGDVVLANRQPTLHTGSMAALDVVIHNDKTFKFPLSLTHRFNLDFDGDEANIHSVQSDAAIAELREKAHASISIISPSTSKPFITVVQDTILSLFLMSSESIEIDDDLIDTIKLNHIKTIRKRLNIKHSLDTFALLSSFFPNELIIDDTFQIICGVWISGLCDKKAIDYIVRVVCMKYGNLAVSDMLTKIQHVAVRWLSRRGFTIDADDVEPLPQKDINNFVLQEVMAGESGRSIRDCLHTMAVEKFKNGNIIKCVKSGAKGSSVNLGQIVATVGQQQCKTGYIEPSLYKNRVMVGDALHNETLYDELIQKGYIVSSFSSGLSPREFFIHCIPSRESLVNTATGTARSGYLQNRIVRLSDDIIYEDGQVVYKSGKSKTLAITYNNNTNPFKPKIDEKYFSTLKNLFANKKI